MKYLFLKLAAGFQIVLGIALLMVDLAFVVVGSKAILNEKVIMHGIMQAHFPPQTIEMFDTIATGAMWGLAVQVLIAAIVVIATGEQLFVLLAIERNTSKAL